MAQTSFTKASLLGGMRASSIPRVAATGISICLLLLFITYSFSGSSRSTPLRYPLHPYNLLDSVQNDTLGFQRIYVINLPSRTDHRDGMSLAAALSDIRVEYVDGVDGREVADKALPPGTVGLNFSTGSKGSWRAHMNALARIIEENVASALILEDDADWDVRLKSQLASFTRGVQTLSQPVRNMPQSYLDPTYPSSKDGLPPVEFDLSDGEKVQEPVHSPYGDNWEVLWLGHCGGRMPDNTHSKTQLGRVVIPDDETVVPKHHFTNKYGTDELIQQYPSHTRVIHHTAENVCTLAYAVTQAAARRMLYQMGLKSFDAPFDILLRKYCDGYDGRRVRNCYTVQPTYFEHFRPRGDPKYYSDIGEFQAPTTEHDYTYNIRLSTRINLEKLTEGDTDLVDQYPDTG